MKNLNTITVLLAITLSFAACSPKAPSADQAEKPVNNSMTRTADDLHSDVQQAQKAADDANQKIHEQEEATRQTTD